MPLLDRILESPFIEQLATAVAAGGPVPVHGVAGSSTVLLVAALTRRAESPVLLVTAHLDDADEAVDELAAVGVEAARFPALEVLPGESGVNLDLLAERLSIVRRLDEGATPAVVVAPAAALMQSVPRAERLQRLHRVVRPGDTVPLEPFVQWLADAGYQRVQAVEEPGDFAVRGGIVDVFAPGAPPARIDFFGDDVDSVCEVDLDTMGSDRRIDSISILAADASLAEGDADAVLLPEMIPAGGIAVLDEIAEITEQGRSYLDRVVDAKGIAAPNELMKAIATRCRSVVEISRIGEGLAVPAEPLPTFAETAADAVRELAVLAGGHDTMVLCQNAGEAQRVQELLAQHAGDAAIDVHVHYLHRGIIWTGDTGRRLAVVPYHELLHRYQTRRRVRRVAHGRAMDAFLEMSPGDYVVHRDHGIAKFVGIQVLDQGGGAEEYLTLEFSGRTRLHVPATRIELVQRYVGAFKGRPTLSTIGGRQWKKQKEKVQEAVRDLAGEMLRIQAARELLPGIRFPDDSAWQCEFEAEFPYEETDDQIAAIAAVKGDMANVRPMDRLLCGDVGFGKTEVAIRAAFKAAEYGKQVAVLVPTTWLAEQHERTFRQRFADYPFHVASISRFKTGKQQKEILEGLARGDVHICIGTHRLLSADVRFADLGLVVIDEEQRFGVEHKQRLLGFRATADVLTMTATPIPRTLHMSMLGLRDISSLATAPLDRRAIVTEVISYDQHRIGMAISRELAREGQVYFVHNRVHDIHDVADAVQRLAPEAKIVVGHGQMPVRQLESVMRKFVRGEADILVSTTIIESGVDIPTANTMFVNDAHRFGLSELHQLRGRVGRHKHRAYCYLMLDPTRNINPDAMKRLRALESFSMLGAGFRIALRDLEIRGAGNLLGAEQSGHISAVGYEMYCRLLESAVATHKNKPLRSAVDTTVDLGIAGALPKGYIPSDQRRMEAYRRLSQANTPEEVARIREDLVSAYGELPQSAERLVEVAEIRVSAAELGVHSISRHERDVIFRTRRPRELEPCFARARGTLRLVGQPDAAGLSTVYYRPPETYFQDGTLLAVLRKRLGSAAPAELAARA